MEFWVGLWYNDLVNTGAFAMENGKDAVVNGGMQMQNISCSRCGKSFEAVSGALFCPFCGATFGKEQEAEPEGAREALQKAEKTEDPKEKHRILLEVEKEFPQSLGIAEALLFLGRLYERGGKHVDFSIIKCHLLMMYLTPGQFSSAKKEEMRQELFASPQLEKCMEHSGDPEAFLRRYLLRLSAEFIRLFLRGDSRYMMRVFGFGMESLAAKRLAAPVTEMLQYMEEDAHLSREQREMLMDMLYQAFSQDMGGETRWLDEKMQQQSVCLPGKR